MTASLFALSLVLVMTSRMQGAHSLAIDLDTAYRYFGEVEDIARKDGGKLWGVKLAGPMMFVDRATMEAVANQPDKEGKLTKRDRVWVGKLPDTVAPANTSLEWAGVRWTMVMWPVSDLPTSRARLLLHECFHRIQGQILLASTNPANAHLDELDGRAWMRLEMRALARALSNSGEQRNAAIMDALDFRFERKRLCGDSSAESERQLELNEGLAEYTGLVLAGYGRPSLEGRAAVRLEQEQSSQTFARSFAYATGPAYGLLLDAFKPDWRKGLNGASSLSALLEESYPSRAWPKLDLGGRAERYGGTEVFAAERRADQSRQGRVAGFRKKFIEGPTLSFPVASQFSYSYDPNALVSFPGVGQVLSTAKITDEWGVLNVTSGGVLLKRNESSITEVVVSAPLPDPSSSIIKGEGWTLALNPGWRLVESSQKGSFNVVRV